MFEKFTLTFIPANRICKSIFIEKTLQMTKLLLNYNNLGKYKSCHKLKVEFEGRVSSSQ